VLAGEKNSPFVRAVMIAGATSLVTNLGNWASDGISVGTATLIDTQGAFGSGMVTAVANPAAQIDFSSD
jgi:hypothetical protein